MLTVIINWLYMLLIVFCLGYAFSRFSEKTLHYELERVDSILMAGLVVSTVYAQIFSLFYRVSIEANVILVLLSVLICVLMGKRMAGFIKGAWKNCSSGYKIVLLALFLLWGFFTSRGYMVPDMDLYHGQSIRWIEEYGVVEGLGNLHSRFGYNSSLFALSALYSMKFLLGHSLHTVNGLIAFLLSVNVLEIRRCFRRGKMLLSDYARVGAAYYLTTIWDEVIAPSSDYAVMCTIFFVVIKWLARLEAEEEGSLWSFVRAVCVYDYIKAVSGVDSDIYSETGICVAEGEKVEGNRHISSSGIVDGGTVDGADSFDYRLAALPFCVPGFVLRGLENDESGRD